MSKLKEIVGYDKRKKVIMKLTNLPETTSVDEIYQIIVQDHKGNPYLFRSIKDKTEPTDTLEDNIACKNIEVDFNDIKETFIMLTDNQRDIVMHVYYLYKKNKNMNNNIRDEEQIEIPKIILQGPAGTGKSTIINLIDKLITWEENKTSEFRQKLKVLKCAFTGKAASNIDGITLNTIFSIPIYKTRNLNKKRLGVKKDMLKECIFFICDEISMVGENLMTSVNLRLQQIFENENLYGERYVLLVGDLYQIDPVKQKPLYPKSHLWTCCEFYELTTIIRQQDETFIRALNNFRNSQMTVEDENLLRSREVQTIDQVPDSVIHLFFLNTHVDDFNDNKIKKSNAKEEIVNVIDDSNDWNPSDLRVKIDIRYMITQNMDVGDGLANGTTGVAKGFDYDADGKVMVIWMEFHSYAIGKKVRSEYFNKHSKPGFENFVPIHRSSVVVKLRSNPKVSRKVNNMFPLKAAEAITVHKSQGQTYHEGVCLHITDHPHDKLRTNKTLQYVALTRVKKLEDLYIKGTFNFSVPNNKKFIRTENELNRLRAEKKLTLAYETFNDSTNDVIIFLNTGLTFNKDYQFISHDRWYSNGSILIFTETNTIGSDEIEMPNFEIAFRSDKDTTLRTGGGIICYKKINKTVEVITSFANERDKISLTLLLYEKYLYIVTGVKGDSSDDDFMYALLKMVNRYIRNKNCIFLIGDFDPKLIDSWSESFNNVKVMSDIANTEELCDIVFTRNIQVDQIGFYEYIPSSHKPIYVKLSSVQM